jgi:hypothetical protein
MFRPLAILRCTMMACGRAGMKMGHLSKAKIMAQDAAVSFFPLFLTGFILTVVAPQHSKLRASEIDSVYCFVFRNGEDTKTGA